MLVGLLFAAPANAQGEWEPLSPSDFTGDKPVVSDASGAEALFWKTHVVDTFDDAGIKSIVSHYIRVRIFTAAGAQHFAQVRIEYQKRASYLSDIAVRTVNRDGSTLELSPREIHEDVAVRVGGHEWRAVTFAPRQVQPGSIVEYRWTETIFDAISHGIVIELQLEIPVRLVSVAIRPLPLSDDHMSVMPMNIGAAVNSVRGELRCDIESVPGIVDEPYAPLGLRSRGLLLAFYEPNEVPGRHFWTAYAGELQQSIVPLATPDAGVRDFAAGLVRGAGSFADSASRMVRGCRRTIRPLTEGELRSRIRHQLKPPTAAMTLADGRGTDLDACVLLLAMARGVGFEARLVLSESRADVPFREDLWFLGSLNVPLVALRSAEGWRFASPRERHGDWDLLPWACESATALMIGNDALETVQLPVTVRSRIERYADLSLSAEGTLEGEIRVRLGGHWTRDWLDHVSIAGDMDSTLRRICRWPTAALEISHLAARIEGEDSSWVALAAHVRLPGFAQVTSSRILLEPLAWNARTPPVFESTSRRQPVSFAFPWVVLDTLRIRLPGEFQVESGQAPDDVAADPVMTESVRLQGPDQDHVLVAVREQRIGGPDAMRVARGAYSVIKDAFDEVAKHDRFVLSLGRAAVGKR